MIDSLEQLRELMAKHEAKASRLRAQLATAEKERDEVEIAIRVIERLTGQSAAVTQAPNENGAVILRFVGMGEQEAQAPKEVQEKLSEAGYDLNPDLVRTQLWRMAKRGILESEGGRYWRPAEPEHDRFSAYGWEVGRAAQDADADEEEMPF